MIGVTATRKGLVPDQIQRARAFLQAYYTATRAEIERVKFHFGDAIGGDQQLFEIAYEIGYWTMAHPCTIKGQRAFCKAHEILPPLEAHARNDVIVQECRVLLVCPYEQTEQFWGGTWYTYRKAKSVGRTVIPIFPLKAPEMIRKRGQNGKA